jgi:alpha-D-ribose 1-methylphosphonate 5-triphosphate synthase subunit PhnG
MQLSKAEVAAIIDYIYQHARTSPNGRAYKVWKKMYDFLRDEQQELNFRATKNADAIDFFQETGIDIS